MTRRTHIRNAFPRGEVASPLQQRRQTIESSRVERPCPFLSVGEQSERRHLPKNSPQCARLFVFAQHLLRFLEPFDGIVQQNMFPMVFYKEASSAAACAMSSVNCVGIEYSSFKVWEVPTKHLGLNRCAQVGCLPVAALQGHGHMCERSGLGTKVGMTPQRRVCFL